MNTCKECGDVIMYCKCYIDDNIELNETNLLKKAIELARTYHKGQKDKAGKPYILHPLRLMQSVESVDEKIVAVLHDIVEDTPISLEDLRLKGFSGHIINAIEALTKKQDEDYNTFIERISHNQLAVKVKLVDLEDNMNLSRLPEITNKDKERLQKYQKAKRFLLNYK